MRKYLIMVLFTFLANIFCVAQWTVIDINVTDSIEHRDVYFLNPDTGIVVGHNYSNNSGYIMRTINGGDTWSISYEQGAYNRVLFFSNLDRGYLASIKDNILRISVTNDGGESWSIQNDSVTQTNLPDLTLKFYNDSLGIVSVPGSSWITENEGLDWTLITENPNGGERDFDLLDSIYFGTESGFLITSYDYAQTFDGHYILNDCSSSKIELWQNSFILSCTASDGGNQEFPSYNYAKLALGNIFNLSFTEIAFPYTHTIMDIVQVNSQIVFAVTWPLFQLESHFIKSIDGGYTWYMQGTSEPNSVPYYYLDNLFCLNDSLCFVAFAQHIYKTTNGGGPLLDEVEQIVLSVKEIKDDLNFSIAPNPTQGGVTVTSEKEIIKEVKVFDLQGKELTKAYPNDFQVQIDLSKFESGVYLIQIMAGDKIRTGKIIKK